MRFAVLLIFLLAACSAEAVQVLAIETPTIDLPGYRTYRFLVQTNTRYRLRGFDARFDGPINQVNPDDLSTVFSDNNSAFPLAGKNIGHDSQFIFSSSEILQIGGRESSFSLAAAVANLVTLDLPNPTPFAQVVTQDGSAVNLRLALDYGFVATDEIWLGTIDSFAGPPQPPIGVSLAIDSHATEGMAGFRTYSVSLVATATQNLALGAKFEGPMHQSSGGAPSPYLSDLTAGDDGVDSHFLYGRDEIWVGSIYERDDAEGLAAAFVIPASTSLDAYTAPLAQITTDDPSSVYYEITLINGDGELVLRGFLVPEPATVMLAALFCVAMPIRLCGRVRP